MLSVGWACAGRAVCPSVWVVLWGGSGGVYLPQKGCAQVRCLVLGAGHSGWTVRVRDHVAWGAVCGGLCPILEKVPTSPLHPASRRQAAAHATTRHTLSHTCWGHTHSQAGGSTPTVGGTGVSPCRWLLPRRGVPCATPETHPLLPPP